MLDSEVIPIFPLPIVALPGEPIPLHIFEPRYKEMVAWCRGQQEMGRTGEFAIFYFHQDKLAPVGSTARLVKVLKQYEDGRLDIMTIGQQRCRWLELNKEYSYDTGTVEWLPDTEIDWDERLATEAFNLHRTIISLVTGESPDERMYAGKTSLSFYLAPSAALPNHEKQAVLEMRSENERLKFLNRHFKQLLLQIENANLSAKAIRSNWELQKFSRNLKP